MKKRLRSAEQLKRVTKQHWQVLALCFAAVGIFVVFNAWYVQTKNDEIAKINQETAQRIDLINITIKEIEARKKAEAEARAAAEQATVAKNAADRAKNSGVSGATSINSKACNPSTTHNDPNSIDVLVNKKHCIQPLGYTPPLTTANGVTLNPLAIDAYKQLYAAAAAAGQPFYVTSSYRSYATQVSTYNKWVSTSGEAGADTYSARPGYSEHQTGFAFDVAASGCTLNCFGSTSQYGWFQQNSANFGFIQRYYSGYEAITGYKAEEWHYRYVGVAVAKDMQAKGVKTLEQYWNMPGGDY